MAKTRFLIILLPMLFFASTLQAHNGRVALGLPVEGIVVDGDLSDWPEDLPRYQVTMAEAGQAPKSPQDFTASFRIAYAVERNLLFVAVEVDDESLVIDRPDAYWDNADGCDVFIGLDHGIRSGSVAQLALWGQNLHAFPAEASRAYRAVVNQRPRGRVYEWSIDVSQLPGTVTQLAEGTDLALDVVVADKDEDGSFSWMAWGARSGKLVSPVRLGDVMLVASSTDVRAAMETAGEMIQRTTQRTALEVRTMTSYLALVSGSLLAVSLLHLMLFWFQRESRTNLYYAIYTACTAGAIFASFQFPVLPLPELVSLMTLNIASTEKVVAGVLGFILLVYGSSLLFLYAFFYDRIPWIGRGILVCMVALPVASMFGFLVSQFGDQSQFAGNSFLYVVVMFVPLLVLSMFIEIPRIVLAAVLRRKPGAWSVGVGFLVFAVCGAALTVRLWARDPIEPWVLLGIVLPLGTMSFRLARSVATVHRDLAERYREVEALSEQLGDQNRALEMANIQIREQSLRVAEADRLKSDFLARMSHDLRTPLNAIIGYTRILLRRVKDEVEPRQYRNLENVRVSADNLLTLINDILDLSRIESGRSEIQIENVDVSELISTCSASLESLVTENVTFSARVDPELPLIRSDQDRLRRVLMNLSGNAIKYTEAGTITITADRDGDHVRLQVTDTGLGIPADDLPHIFDEFRRIQLPVFTSFRHHSADQSGRGSRNAALNISRILDQIREMFGHDDSGLVSRERRTTR